MLVLPGGKPVSEQPSRARQLANLRMALLTAALRRQLGPGVQVRRVRYRMRGWNAPRLDALRDAEAALREVREQFDAAHIVVVGHSMGGRVAAHLSARHDVGAIVALAPWWPEDDGDVVPASCRLLVVHGTADTWTSPGASRAQARRAAERGVDGQWVGLDGAGHYMLRQARRWHTVTAEFAAAALARLTEQ